MSERDTSFSTMRSRPLRTSLPRARSRPSAPVSAANPTSTWPGRRAAPIAASDVGGRLELERPGALAGALRVERLDRAVVGDRSRHQDHVGRRRHGAAPHARGRPRSRPRPPRRAGDERSRSPGAASTLAPRRAASSASAAPIRPELRLPRKRTGSSGSRVPPAVTRIAAAVERARTRAAPPITAAIAAGSLIRPMPALALGERALLGPDEHEPALAQRRDVRAGRRVRPTSARSSPARRRSDTTPRARSASRRCRRGRARAWPACSRCTVRRT